MLLEHNLSDFIFCLGHISNRDPCQGSIFIQALCKELNEKWYQMDISSIASSVNKRIMQGSDRIQAPIFENQLGDYIYLRPDFHDP